MNNVFSALCGVINFMPPWIMLGVFGAIILLIVLILVFKGFKRKFFRVVIYVLLGLIPLSYLAYLGVQVALLKEQSEILQVIAFAINWGPTIFFAAIILIGLLRGIRRGLRKSLILALHATCAGIVCVAFFFIMVYVKEVDAGALNFANLLMGGDGALQRMLGVPESCSTLKEVLAEYIPVLVGTESDLGLILADNSAYVYTLVDMVYRIIFALISFGIFLFIDFVLYIVYVLCYSQRKYRKNKILEFENGKTDRTYRRHFIGGGVVGLVRGVATGLLAMAFLGSVFYIAAGGKGDGTLDDHDFKDDDVNFYYQIYRSIDGYGSQGIFKILNAMSDATDTPYYLFAADLIFSGELDDEEAGVSGNIKFREELAAFTGFARDTFDLIMKYGSEELDSIIGEGVTDGAFDTVVQVITKAGFKEEFDSLIDKFDAQTYIINLSMSLVNSIVRNVDELSFTSSVGEGERELIKLIFRKGFLTENIPDERDLIAATGKTEAEGDDIRPYLTVNHILNKKDVKLVLNVVLSILAGEETGDMLQLIERVIPELGKLSILSTERKAELNPVLGRMYCLFENLYLTADGEDGLTYSEMSEENIDWVGEFNTLLDVVDDVLLLYNNLSTGGEALDIVRSLFDENSPDYEENMRAYDNVCSLLTDSRVLGRALSTNFVYKTVASALMGLSPNIYIPDNLSFGNTYDKNGNLISYGETYLLLNGVKLLFSGDNVQVLDALMNMGEDTAIDEVLGIIATAIETPDDKGNTLSTYLTESDILRSVISIELIEVGGNTFYVPKAAREYIDGEYKNLILKRELKQLLDNMSKLVDFVMPFIGDSTDWETEVDGFIESDDFYDLVKTNRIFEGTVAQTLNVKLIDNIESNGNLLVIPAAIRNDIDGWITIDGRQGELINLIDALRATDFKVSDILLAGSSFGSSSVLEKITSPDADLETFFDSSVLHYTVSNYILNEGASLGSGFVLVVPVNSRQLLKNDSIDYLIKKSELISVFEEISTLGLYEEDGTDISKILVKIANDETLLTGSKIIPASIVATLVANTDVADDLLAIPQYYKEMGSVAELEYYDSTNPWVAELPCLIDALSEVLGLKGADEDFTFDDGDLNAEISDLLVHLNDDADIDEGVYPARSKLRVLYDSVIFRSKITDELDKNLDGLVDGAVINYVKLGGYYTFDELQSLCNAVSALGITSLQDLSDFGFSDVADLNGVTESGETRLNVVYGSVIAKGVITKAVQDVIAKNASLCDHPLAYENYLSVYKESEIACIVDLFTDFESGEIDLGNIGKFIYDDGETKSYILVATVSAQLIDNAGLIIPHTVVENVEGKNYIKPLELGRVVEAFNVLKDDYDVEDFNDWTDDMDIAIPEEGVRDIVFASEIIRARIVFQLSVLNGQTGGVLAVKLGNGETVTDVRETHSVGETATVTAEQLEYLARALEIIYEGEADFRIPVFDDVDKILELSDRLDELIASDIVLYRICEFLASYHVDFDEETAFDLENAEDKDGVKTATKEQILAAAEQIKEALNRYGN